MEGSQQDPSKFHIFSKKQKVIAAIIGLIVAFVVVPAVLYVYYTLAVNRPSQLDRDITIEVPRGSNVYTVATDLYEKGVLNSKFLFIVYMRTNNLGDRIQSGVFTIKAGATIRDLGEILQHGKDDVKVTFLEGWRLEQFASHAAKSLNNIRYQSFMDKAQGLEGYLYPDTYIVNKDVEEEELISLLRKNFETKTKDLLSKESLDKIGVDKNTAIILSSLLEREVRHPEDRAIVAGIMLKRLNEGMTLGIDATVQYAVTTKYGCSLVNSDNSTCSNEDWWPKELTYQDLQIDSPYNTRKNPGLPPAPISSFSYDTLESLVNHKKTDYYFYLTDSTGTTHFAKTLKDHEANIAKYL